MNIPAINTAMSRREAHVVRQYARGRAVVEFGALLGFSTVLMAQVASSVVSVDRHEGYGPGTLRKFLSNLDRFRVTHTVRSVQQAVSECAPFMGDVGFIDLDGTLSTTLMALSKCLCPTVLIHDLSRVHCNGVEAAIKQAGLTIIEHTDSLAVCAR